MKKKFILRLDDACETMDIKKWNRVEKLLDEHKICPLVGVVPHNEDSTLMIDERNKNFWDLVKRWEKKGWSIAMHGYNHVYISNLGGLNPIHNRSEFAGVTYEKQKEKIVKGHNIFIKHNIRPGVFFAPSHTFDLTTLEVIKKYTDIKIISDTIANDIYYKHGLYFIPQQSGQVRYLPFKVVTFCYHPNLMKDKDFDRLNKFLKKYNYKFVKLEELKLRKRKMNLLDKLLRVVYFSIKIKGGKRP